MGALGTAVDQIFASCERNPHHYAEMLGALKPKVTSGRIRVICPSCGQRSGWLIPGDKIIKCDHKNNCGGKTHVLAAMLGRTEELLIGADFNAAVKQAALITGISIDEQTDFNPAARVINRPALEKIWHHANEQLKSQAGADAVAYLSRRGFSNAFIAENFGAVGSVGFLARIVGREELEQTGLVSLADPEGKNWEDRILIPARDAYGRIVGLIGRCISREPRKDKYRYSAGYKKATDLFGLNLARRHTTIIVTEGQIDVLKLNMLGIKCAVALGGCSMGREQLLILASQGAEKIVCFFDTDRAGEEGVLRLLDSFDAERDSPELHLGELPHGKDPDEYLDIFGLSAFLELAERAVHAHRFRARYWFKQLQRDGLGILKDGELPRYVEQCARYIDSITSSSVKLRASGIFLPEVCALSGVDRSDIRGIRSEYVSTEQKKQNTRRLIQSIGSALGKVKEGDYLQSRALLESALTDTRDIRSKLCGPDEAIEEVRAYFKKIASRDLIGIRTGFRPIDENLSGARGLMLLAGGSNVGKTTLVGQLMADVCMGTNDACVLFLSCEMLRREINARLLSRLSGFNWLDLRGLYGQEQQETSAFWESRLHDEILKNSLVINPRTDGFLFTRQGLVDAANWLKEKTGRKRCKIIADYLDVIPGHEEQAKDNEIIRQKYVCDDLLYVKEQLSEDDPVFAITTVRKNGQAGDRERMTFDDVMGSAYKVYCSDIAIIWNAFSDKMLFENCDFCPEFGVIPFNEPQESDWHLLSKKGETRTKLRRMREWMDNRGIGFSRLELAKVRDGMKKGAFNVTVNYFRSSIAEGLIV